MITLGIIGIGHWGQNYLKLADKLNINFLIGTRDNWKELIQSRRCEGIIIATPPDSHIEIAIECLKNKLPTMIEKPLALTLQEALLLKEYENEALILINHLHLFSPAFEKIIELVNPKEIKNIISIGTNIGPFRDYSSLLDYGVHDLSMALHLINSNDPINIEEIYFLSKNYDSNIGYTTNLIFKYCNFIRHNLCVGNAGPDNQRLFEIEMLNGDVYSYNDKIDVKLKFNNKAIDIKEISTLENSLNHFIRAVKENYTDARFGLKLGLKTLEILEPLL